jgi:membrane protease YdiL (CAAX protease family)
VPLPDAPPDADGDARAAPQPATLRQALAAAAITTAAVTALSWLAPEKYAATLVGLAFLAATWWLVLRRDEETVRAFGLSLGGLLEPVAIAPRKLAKAALGAIGWASLLALIAFPPFFFGFRAYYQVAHFHFRLPASPLDDVAGQLVAIALPEEAFFRGYLQTALDQSMPPRWRILGADLGPGWILSAAIFALGHFFTRPHPERLAVFFPALVFGWVRARTKGVGAGIVFHAACNVFSATLARSYGLAS